MKVLFLDIDGVLNEATFLRTFVEPGTIEVVNGEWNWRKHIDPERVAVLNRVLNATGAAVVVSSSWRCRYTVDELQTMLQDRGFTGSILDSTPRLFGHDRFVEIQHWLSGRLPRSIEAFAIVDVDLDASVGFESRFVRTSGAPGGGLRDEHAERLIQILGRAS